MSDVLMITDTKLYDSFPEQQFHIEDFNMTFRLDLNSYGGRLLFYVCNNINVVFTANIEAFFIEIFLKWVC